MQAWAYTLTYNEAHLIPYWVRHFRSFCEKAIVYVDCDTTDDTGVVAEREGAEVREYQGSGQLDDLAFVQFANTQYQEARGQADWVIWTDADEILYHPQISQRLDDLLAAGVNLPHTEYFVMTSDSLPTHEG